MFLGDRRAARNRPHFIYITGADGTGKSTQAQLLLERLRRQGVRCRHVWLRFPFFLSVPLLAYARWRGFSWVEKHGSTRHGYWDFQSSPLLRALLPWSVLFDAALAAAFRIYWPLCTGRTVVCERFVLDMLVDLMVAFGSRMMHRKMPGTFYRYLIPRRASIVILGLDATTIRQRRPDLKTDRRLESRLRAFHQLASDLGLARLSTERPVCAVQEQIVRFAEG